MYQERTAHISVSVRGDEFPWKKVEKIPPSLEEWFKSFDKIHSECNGIYVSCWDVIPSDTSEDLLEVTFHYKNVDPDWDEGNMYAKAFLADPDDDGNHLWEGQLVKGTVVYLSEPTPLPGVIDSEIGF